MGKFIMGLISPFISNGFSMGKLWGNMEKWKLWENMGKTHFFLQVVATLIYALFGEI